MNRNDELERILKGEIVASLKYCFSICLEGDVNLSLCLSAMLLRCRWDWSTMHS